MQQELSLGSEDVFVASSLFMTHLKSIADRGESLESAWYLSSGKLTGKRYFGVPICLENHYSMVFIADIWGATRFFHYDSTVNYHNSDDLFPIVAEYIRVLRLSNPNLEKSDLDMSTFNFYKLKGPIQPNSHHHFSELLQSEHDQQVKQRHGRHQQALTPEKQGGRSSAARV